LKNVALLISALILCSLSSAAARQSSNGPDRAAQTSTAPSASHSPLATDVCSFTFTSGSGPAFLKYCVTGNGNITQFEAPQGHEHVRVGDFSEGYGICDFNANVAYFDYADSGDSGNWGTATVLSHSAKSVKIARTTSDGIWTLTQTIAQVAGTPPLAQITMTIKNNSAIQRSMRLFRFVDVDADGVFDNNLDGTFQTSFGWNSTADGRSYGLAMVNEGKVIFPNAGYAQSTPTGPDPCNPFVNSNFKTIPKTDGSLVHFYTLDVRRGSSMTVRIAYKGM